MADLQRQSSFIPKQPAKGNVKNVGVRKIYILNYITYVIFFGTLIVTAGVFVYSWLLDSQTNKLIERLDAEQQTFSEAELLNVKAFNTQINTAIRMLDSHVSVVSILKAIEESVVGQLRLLDFSYTRAGLSAAPEIVVSAETDSFNAVLFQKQVLAANPVIQNVDIQNVLLQTKPIDPTNLLRGASQIIAFNISAKFNLDDVNFTGRTPVESFGQQSTQSQGSSESSLETGMQGFETDTATSNNSGS